MPRRPLLAGPAPRALICREELLPPPDEWPPGTELVFEGRMSRVNFVASSSYLRNR